MQTDIGETAAASAAIACAQRRPPNSRAISPVKTIAMHCARTAKKRTPRSDGPNRIPWTLVRQSEKDTPGFVLHADKAKLEAGKFFDEKNWPDMHDLTLNKAIYDHYTVTPYYWIGA